eukprot:m.144688 g.144688  ORF g.144688 m.144688 type:complete len:1888 (+) comp11603_c0_seq2:145-5808(+)
MAMSQQAQAVESRPAICRIGTDIHAKVAGAPPTAVRGGVWNQHLPSADRIPREAAANLEAIKHGLADAVAMQTLTPGLRYWCGRLTDHLVLYQYDLSVEDHVHLAVLLFRLFDIEGIDETLQERTAAILRRLLRKQDLLPSTALIIEWRPLYDLITKHFFCKLRRTSEVHRGLGDAIVKLIKDARRFFPATATAEILDEMSPMLCPHDEVCFRAAAFLSLLLPTNGASPAASSPHFLGWFERLLTVWGWVRNTPDWDFAFVQLYARVARDNLGTRDLDWAPHLPWLFNKILAMFHIPVGTAKSQAQAHSYGLPWNAVMLLPGGRGRVTKAAVLIVYMMTPDNEVLTYLDRLLASIKAFYHPSNTGRWSSILASFMLSLCEVFAMRAREERADNSVIPAAVRLSDADWKRFVGILVPYVSLAQFSKSPTMVASAAWALRHLSYLAPELVLPGAMKRIYPALETVTETHQAFAALSTLAAVARPLLWAENFTGGAKHLVPLLQLTLPGIDPNDGNKTQVTLQFLMVLFNNVYLVDCTGGPIPNGMSDDERQIIMSTSLFEDWAMQFFDRVFSVLENLVPPSKRKGHHTTEGSLCEWIDLILQGFFQQVSPPIFKLALDRVFNWLSGSMIMHLGKTAGKICAAAAAANPTVTLKKVMPFVTDRILNMLPYHDTVDEVDESSDAPLDDELQWYLNIVARTVIRTGESLLEYRDQIIAILERGLRLKAKQAAKLCGKLLRHTLKALTGTYVRDTSTLTKAQRATWDTDPVGLFRQWGNSPDVLTDDLAIEWHVASPAELEFASELVDLFYRPAVATLDGVAKGKIPFRHDVMLNTLMVVRNCVRVGAAIFPESIDPNDDLYMAPKNSNANGGGGGQGETEEDDEAGMGAPTYMARLKIDLDVVPVEFVAQHKENRPELMAVAHGVIEKLLSTSEDDTKLFKVMIKILYQLLCVRGITDRKYGRLSKVWAWLKQGSADLVRPGKRYSRAMLLRRVDMQHQRRLNKGRVCIAYTKEFRQLLHDLVTLGASRYAIVRKRAQNVISHVTATHPIARHDVFGDALKLLDVQVEDMEDKHQQIKGAMYMLGSKSISRLAMRQPKYVAKLARQLLILEGNDRPSVQAQVNQVFGQLGQENRATSLGISMEPALFDAAKAVFPAIADKANVFAGASADRAKAHATTARSELVACQTELASILNTNVKGWKMEVLVAGLLASKIRDKVEVPDTVLAYFTNALVSDSLKLRQLAVRATSFILAVTKQRPLKDTYGFDKSGAVLRLGNGGDQATAGTDNDAAPRVWSPRADVLHYPHCFASACLASPPSKDAYNATVFVDKNYIGWSLFPIQTVTYPPPRDQPVLSPTPPISLTWDVISRADFFEQHCDLFSQDKADGTAARFSESHAEMYKGFARNHGLPFLQLVQPHIERLLAPCETDGLSETTAKFRCAGELIAGIVRGSKHWSFDDLEVMWAFIVPTLESTLARIEHHTIGNFASMLRYCVYDRDPRRYYPLAGVFFKTFSLDRDNGDTSFAQFRHLEMYVAISEELSWRGVEAADELLHRMQPFAAHPYKLVREKISRCLATVFRARLAPGRDTPDPVGAAFVADVTQSILSARDLADEDETKVAAILLAKTIIKWMTIVFYEGFDSVLTMHLSALLPVIMVAPELSREDDELGAMANQALGFVAQTKMSSRTQVTGVLETICTIADDESWHVRERALCFVQIFFFRNLFFVPKDMLSQLVVKSLEDPQLEVRDLASATLSGMVRCGLVGDDLLQQCVALSNTKIRKVKARRAASAEPSATPLTEQERRALVQRHAGILGVQAFVAGFPYDIPSWLPDVLLGLATKIGDPEPLKASVKKTLGEFWRTHQDDRQALVEAFDEDQFATLRDLVVGYNYYA